MRLRYFDWYDDEGDFVTKSTDEIFATSRNNDTPPTCPKCGEKACYWEGQVDQDIMGNDIDGWDWECYQCGIHTDIVFLD